MKRRGRGGGGGGGHSYGLDIKITDNNSDVGVGVGVGLMIYTIIYYDTLNKQACLIIHYLLTAIPSYLYGVTQFYCKACEQALHLGESREVTMKGDAIARGR